MNIRSVSNPAQILAQDKVEATRRDIKSDSTTERDGNGQQPQGEERPWRPLTDEELQQVVEKIRHHEGIQKHDLKVNLYVQESHKVVKIETQEGEVVKRITERELFDYLFSDQDNNFHLVKRTA